MRLRSLELVAFGPFSGGSLELGTRPGAVDLVYGSNEAGKSTTLRAITGLLFGIPDTRDAYRHEPSKVRVGGTLESGSGAAISVVRRRGRRGNTLRDGTDQPLDDAILEPFLHGLTREIFLGLFGLDHETLRKGGEELAQGKGSLGEALFAAGMGARGLHELSVRLEEESARLFVKGGKERAVNKAMSEVELAREAVRSAVTTPARYDEQKQAHAEAVRRKEALRKEAQELSTEQSRLQRVLAVLPHLRRRVELEEQITALGDVVDLGPDAAVERSRAVRALEEASREIASASRLRADLEARLGTVTVREELLALDEGTLGVIGDGLNRYLSAQKDIPKRTGEAVANEEAVKRRLEALGVKRAEGELQIPVAEAARIRALAQKRARLDDQRAALVRARSEVLARRENWVRRLAKVAAPSERERLAERLRAPDAPSSPGLETIERFARARAELQEGTTRLSRQVEEKKARRAVTARKLTELLEAGAVPSEAELASERASRDEAFRQLRGRALAGPATEAELSSYQGRVVVADGVADRLRREAGRVAERARLEAELSGSDEELRTLVQEQASLSDVLAGHEAEWAALWTELGIAPLPPAEMRAWARDRDASVVEDEAALRTQAELLASEQEVEAWEREWALAVARLGRPGTTMPEEALAILDAMAQVAEQAIEAGSLRRRIEGMHRDSAHFADVVARAASRVFPEASAASDPGDAARRLLDGVESARAAHAERARLTAEVERVRVALAAEEARRADASARLEGLLAAAAVHDVDSLLRAEVSSEEARRLREQVRIVDEQLAAAGDGAPLEALQVEAAGHDLDRVRVRLREIDAQLGLLDEQADAAKEEAWSLERHLHNLEHTDAVERSALLQDKVALLKRQVHRYLRVKLASAVLSREIERYRRENQGPLLGRASELFPRLTLGAYAGLRADFDESGKPVLLAVRPDGATVGTPELSDGTRDQLFLALRLASLERYVQVNDPVPLVLDDVLVHFDEDRARAALAVLGETAKVTQILFFTHHARVVELARDALGPERLAEHRLPTFG